MFLSEFTHNIDDKGRLIMPAKFRPYLGEQFIATRGMDGCLFIYTKEEWSILENKLNKLPLTKKDARAFVRFFYSAATELTLDKQGRMNLPSTLIKYAKLKKSCQIIGVSNRIEIWDKDLWQQFNEEAYENFDEIAEEMLDFDF